MEIIILCGPPGSGKTSETKKYLNHTRVSQDDFGKQGHMDIFLESLSSKANIIVDRMSFNKEQRSRYLLPAKAAGYTTKIIILHESYDTCLTRMLARIADGHPTIQDEKSARSALHTFFTRYERPTEDEADSIEFRYPPGEKPSCVGIDLDGTLANIDHRLHFVRHPRKKDWKNFLYNIPGDKVNDWCEVLIDGMNASGNQIVYCSGRGSEYRGMTIDWLKNNQLYNFCFDGKKHHLYMRERGDHRADTAIKEILLDFEILTRFYPEFFVDDRPSVCRMWRSRGFNCLQIQDKEF
jgi:adenylate kinase family enzyme